MGTGGQHSAKSQHVYPTSAAEAMRFRAGSGLALVTGATGLVGRRVISLLMPVVSTVRVLALPGTEHAVPHRDAVEVVSGNLLDQPTIDRAAAGAELVFHMAALLPGAPYDDLMRVNVHGTENLMRGCVRSGTVRRVVFTSSVSVYGSAFDQRSWPVKESDPLHPAGPEGLRGYGRSKVAAERVVQRYCSENGIEWVIVRPSTVYGRGGDVFNHAEQMVRNVLSRAGVGAGRAADVPMQMVHVDDLAEAMVLAGLRAEARGGIFNIAGSEVVTGREMVGLIRGISDRFDTRYQASAAPAASRRCHAIVYDTARAERVLGFRPSITLEQGFEELVLAEMVASSAGARAKVRDY